MESRVNRTRQWVDRWRGASTLAGVFLLSLISVVVAMFLSASDRGEASAAASATAESPLALRQPDANATGHPEAVVDATEFNFGTMAVGEEGARTFVVRNHGTATLQLQPGDTTCHCTSLTIVDQEIPPGKQGSVRLRWVGDAAASEFHQGAEIRTNDPHRSRILLRVVGRMTVLLGASPETVVYADVRGEKPRTQRLIVFSQEWEQFEIANVRASMKHLSWKVLPADRETLAQVGGRAGYAIDLTLDPELPKGPFSGTLSVDTKRVAAGGQAQHKSMDLQIHGNRTGNVTFIGRIADGDGFLDIGAVERDRGARHTVHLVIRNHRPKTRVTSIETFPEYLNVSATPDPKSVPGRAWFRLDLEVPAGSPLADFMAAEMGEVRLKTDDPENPEINVKARFAVFEP